MAAAHALCADPGERGRPQRGAGSGGQRNASANACDGVLKLEGLSRAFVELLGDGVEVGLGQGAEVEASGQVLTQQAVGVLVAAALPRRLGVAEVDLHAGLRR